MNWQVWQSVQMAASIAQFVLYIAGFINYKNRLEDLADELETRSDAQFQRYKTLRDNDQKFNDFYKDLPDYETCLSNIKRARGAAASRYGEGLRRSFGTVRGYLPHQRVAIVNMLGQDMAMSPAVKRAQVCIAERSREDTHLLNRWQAIVSAPTNASVTNDVGNIIKASFTSLGAFGQGANSAGTAIGAQLFGRLNG